jgi:Zn-dependent protease
MKFKICDAFGIPIVADVSSLILVAFIVYSFGSISLGISCAILLMLSIVLHELGHSLVAMAFGKRIMEIRLSLLGGCASGEIPRKAWKEFLVAMAGPAVSIFLGVIGLLILLFAPITNHWLINNVQYFLAINFMLALFNLLPGFPMDGGRIFRSFMRFFVSRQKATYCAMVVGRAFAVLLVALPLLGIKSIWIIPVDGNFFIRLFIAIMIWRESYREYMMSLLEPEDDLDDFSARVSPPPYGGTGGYSDVRRM